LIETLSILQRNSVNLLIISYMCQKGGYMTGKLQFHDKMGFIHFVAEK